MVFLKNIFLTIQNVAKHTLDVFLRYTDRHGAAATGGSLINDCESLGKCYEMSSSARHKCDLYSPLIIALHAVSSVRLLCYSPLILQMKEEDSELPVSAARPARTSSFPKTVNFCTGRPMNLYKPICLLTPLSL